MAESLARRKQADDEAALNPTASTASTVTAKRKSIKASATSASTSKNDAVRDLWKDVDEDDFFGASKPMRGEDEEMDDAEVEGTPVPAAAKKKKKGGARRA